MPEIPQRALKPYWQTKDESIRLYQGHAPDVLRRLPENSVQMCVTSPPYWALREYKADKEYEIGREETYQEYVANMVAVFREVKRVLRPDGLLFLNLGDTFLRGNLVGVPWKVAFALQDDGWILRSDIIWKKASPMPDSCTDRYAKSHEYIFMFCKSGGYYFDIDAVREPYADGSKAGDKKRKVDFRSGTVGALRTEKNHHVRVADGAPTREVEALAGATKKDVWTVAHGGGYDGLHFATYPPKLVEPCILSGSSQHGACSECGAPYERLTDREKLTRERPNDLTKRTGEAGTGNSCGNTVAGVSVKTLGWQPTCECFGRFESERQLVPKSDNRYTGGDRNQPGDAGASPRDGGEKWANVSTYVSDLPLSEHPVQPCTVLDPFIGSGTTAVVALAHGRHCIGIDLSETYLRDNAIPRIQGALLNRPGLAHLAGFEATKFDGGANL